jgi:hypothetical protein
MRTVQISVGVLVGVGMFLGLFTPSAEAENRFIRLNGLDEVPVVITGATGELRVSIDEGNQTIRYVLSYERIEGGDVLQAHIHLGQVHTTGQIVLFLCTNVGGAPASPPAPATPPCPVGPDGTVTGTLTPASVIARPAQGVNNLPDVIEAIRNGVAYANVHTTVSPSGEIRANFHGRH